MGKRIDAAKEHLTKYKWHYISAGLFVGIAGITCLIVRRSESSLDANPGLTGASSLSEKPRINGDTSGEKPRINGDTTIVNYGIQTNPVVNVFARDGRGHPGYMIQCNETGALYSSQAAAAADMNLSSTSISNHLNGRSPHVNDFTFSRIQPIA